MKAIRVHQFGEPEVLKLEDAPDPKPSAGQVIVDVKAVGVNPVEGYIRKGIYGPKEFPYTPGADGAVAGNLWIAGADVDGIRPAAAGRSVPVGGAGYAARPHRPNEVRHRVSRSARTRSRRCCCPPSRPTSRRSSRPSS